MLFLSHTSWLLPFILPIIYCPPVRDSVCESSCWNYTSRYSLVLGGWVDRHIVKSWTSLRQKDNNHSVSKTIPHEFEPTVEGVFYPKLVLTVPWWWSQSDVHGALGTCLNSTHDRLSTSRVCESLIENMPVKFMVSRVASLHRSCPCREGCSNLKSVESHTTKSPFAQKSCLSLGLTLSPPTFGLCVRTVIGL